MRTHLLYFSFRVRPTSIRSISGPPPSPAQGSWYSPLLNSTFVPNIFGWSSVDPVICRFTRLSNLLCSFVWASILLSVCCLKIGCIGEFLSQPKKNHLGLLTSPIQPQQLVDQQSRAKYHSSEQNVSNCAKKQNWRFKDGTCSGRQIGLTLSENFTAV